MTVVGCCALFDVAADASNERHAERAARRDGDATNHEAASPIHRAMATICLYSFGEIDCFSIELLTDRFL